MSLGYNTVLVPAIAYLMRCMITKIIRKIVFGGSPRLHPIERLVLSKIEAALGEPNQGIFRSQVASLKWVQRQNRGRRIVLTLGDGVFPLASNDIVEFRLARLTLAIQPRPVFASVYCYLGLLKYIDYSPLPKAFLRADIRECDVSLEELGL